MVENAFYHSVGALRYSSLDDGTSKLIVEVDRGISQLAFSLIPKYYHLHSQRHPPHISVIRHEGIIKHPKWGLHEGLHVPFEYGTYVFDNGLYYWLRVRSESLIEIRLELGLLPHSKNSRPPDGTRWFHITVGNSKEWQNLIRK